MKQSRRDLFAVFIAVGRLLFGSLLYVVLWGCVSSPSEKPLDSATSAYLDQFRPFKNVLEVDGNYPHGLTSEWPQEFFVHFSQPMVSLQELGKTAEPGFIELTPEISGTFIWEDPRTLSFRPLNRFLPNTTYVVRVKAGMEALSGAALLKEFNFTFLTPAVVADNPVADSMILPKTEDIPESPASDTLQSLQIDADLPRFLRRGDVFTASISLSNNLKKNVALEWNLEAPGVSLNLAKQESLLELAAGSRSEIRFKGVVSSEAGIESQEMRRVVLLKFAVTGDGISEGKAFEIPLVSARNRTIIALGRVSPKENRTFSFAKSSDSSQGEIAILLGNDAEIFYEVFSQRLWEMQDGDLSSRLLKSHAALFLTRTSLDQYDRNVREMVDVLQSRQMTHGGFEEKGWDDDDQFILTIIAAHFLRQASRSGYDVSEILMRLKPYFDFEIKRADEENDDKRSGFRKFLAERFLATYDDGVLTDFSSKTVAQRFESDLIEVLPSALENSEYLMNLDWEKNAVENTRKPVSAKMSLNGKEILFASLDPVKTRDALKIPLEKMPHDMEFKIHGVKGDTMHYAVYYREARELQKEPVLERGISVRREVVDASVDKVWLRGEKFKVRTVSYVESFSRRLVWNEELPAGMEIVKPMKISVLTTPRGGRLCGEVINNHSVLRFAVCDAPAGLVRVEFEAIADIAGEFIWTQSEVHDASSPQKRGRSAVRKIKIL